MEISENELNKLKLDKLSLEKENIELKGKLTTLKTLDEELTAKRVFDLAHKRLMSYLTVGGVVTIILGFIGYKTVTDFAKEQAIIVAKKMDSITVTKMAAERMDIRITQISKKELLRINHNLNDSAAALFKNISNKIVALSQPQSLSKEPRQDIAKHVNHHELPPTVDLSNIMGPVRDQGSEGSVVGFALADLLTGTYNVQQSKLLIFSPRYIYNSINHHLNNGAVITDGLNLLSSSGAVLEKDWPYVSGQYAESPPASLNKVTHYKIDGYLKVDLDINKFKALLYSKRLV